MNNKGNVKEAFKQFRKDFDKLGRNKEYCFDSIKVKESLHPVENSESEKVIVFRNKEICIDYGRVDVYTKESRRLNDKLFKKIKHELKNS